MPTMSNGADRNYDTTVNDARRQALSPTDDNKKSGLNNTRQLVSSLRSKREDLIKRYDPSATVSNNRQDEPDQENDADANKKSVVDLSWLNEDRQTEEDRTSASGCRPGKLDYSKYEKRDEAKPLSSSGGGFEGYKSKVRKVVDSSTIENQIKPLAKQQPLLSSPKARNSISSEADSWIKRDTEEAVTGPIISKVVEASWIKNGNQPQVVNATIKLQSPKTLATTRKVAGPRSWVMHPNDEYGSVGSPVLIKRKSAVVAAGSSENRRKSVESTVLRVKKEEDKEEKMNPRAMLKSTKKKSSRQLDDRRKSAPAASWIKHGSAPQDELDSAPSPEEHDSNRKVEAPWIFKNRIRTSSGEVSPQISSNGGVIHPKIGAASGLGPGATTTLAPGSPLARFSSKRMDITAKNPASSPEWTRAKLSSPRGGNITSKAMLFDEGNAPPVSASKPSQPSKMDSGIKVGMLDSSKASIARVAPAMASPFLPSNDSIMTARQRWEAAQLSEKGFSSTKKLDFERSSEFSSLKKSMERISFGLDTDSPEAHRSQAEQSGQDDRSEQSVANGSTDQSAVFEYGDANFSFRDDYQDQENVDSTKPEEYGFEYDEASEGSTYKVDNYQKEFNAAIPIQCPWETPADAFDNLASDMEDMKIISIAPSGTEFEAPFEFDPLGSTFRDSAYASKPSTDRNLVKGRTCYHVGRKSAMYANSVTQDDENGAGYVMFGGEDEADPIFQVSGEIENRVRSNKGMFKILKKGLVNSVRKDSSEDVSDLALEASGDATDDQCSYTGTTISSITRSVISQPMSADSNKPAMPLGVFNGFFKAARKLKKKSKKKSRRGRSMSNKAPTAIQRQNAIQRERGDMIVDFKPQTVAGLPPTEAAETSPGVQLWPDVQKPEPEPMPRPPNHHNFAPPHVPALTTIKPIIGDDRRFGTYGGLASSRSKAVDASNSHIQSLASW